MRGWADQCLALQMVRELIRPGISTAELDGVAEDVIRQHGGTPAFKNYPGPYPFPATLCISINEELVHGMPGKRKLQEGDIVSVDCGTIFDGFVADSAFTGGAGEISPQAKQLLDN
jgi:methionyl aminopeptidase